MPVLERKIIHDMATSCSHVSYPRFVLPLHKHVEFEIMLFTRGSGKQFVGEGCQTTRRATWLSSGAMCRICICAIPSCVLPL